jgi:hypothetical protein
MPNLLTQHKVRNYEEWRPHFDRHDQTRVAAGISNPRVYRNASDPNDLVLLFDVADVERAKQFGQSQDLRETMERAGVVMPPTVRVLE